MLLTTLSTKAHILKLRQTTLSAENSNIRPRNCLKTKTKNFFFERKPSKNLEE